MYLVKIEDPTDRLNNIRKFKTKEEAIDFAKEYDGSYVKVSIYKELSIHFGELKDNYFVRT